MIKRDFKKHSFSDRELEILRQNGTYRNRYASECPVCHIDPYNTFDEFNVRIGGTFRYKGVEYDCPTDDYGHVAHQLAMLYWLCNIPLEYQKLVWDEWLAETGNQDAWDFVNEWVEDSRGYSTNGVGMTFYSKGLGTGKTWAATAAAKQLAKRGVDVWFAPFYEVANYWEIPDEKERWFKIKRVQEADVLVLDELRGPISERQERYLGEQLENLIRPRSSANLTTIITTNLTPDQIEDHYPRAFSLISAKNKEIELTGTDARLGNKVWSRQAESVANGEALPIT